MDLRALFSEEMQNLAIAVYEGWASRKDNCSREKYFESCLAYLLRVFKKGEFIGKTWRQMPLHNSSQFGIYYISYIIQSLRHWSDMLWNKVDLIVKRPIVQVSLSDSSHDLSKAHLNLFPLPSKMEEFRCAAFYDGECMILYDTYNILYTYDYIIYHTITP